MARPVRRPRALEYQVFRARDALDAGLLTPNELRGSAWRRVLRGVYADSRLEFDHELRCRAAALICPPQAAIAGPSAALLHGIDFAATPEDDVHVLVPRAARFGPVQGLRVHTSEIPATDVGVRQQLRCTEPLRTAWDVAVWLDVVPAVVILDGLLGAGMVKPDDLAALHAARSLAGARGARTAGRAFGLADGRSGSPQESRLRVRLVLAGLPRPMCQYEVVLASGLVLHPDLAWPEYKVAVEYDGGYHAEPDRLHLDRRRLNQFVTAGWIVLHVTSVRMRSDFGGIVREVRAALESRGARLR
jgi:hypothetical protein